MAMADTRDRLAAELTGPIGLLGLDLEAVDLTSAGKRRVLRVAIDKDGGVTMDDIADATREVSRVLDDTDLMGRQAYTLEVSSPGCRSTSHPAAPLAAQHRPPGQGGPHRGRADDRADHRDRRRRCRARCRGHRAAREYAEVKKAKIQIEFKKETP